MRDQISLTPKICDFGLAKLCSKDESIVSIINAKGTLGYIAPEVFSRNFGNYLTNQMSTVLGCYCLKQ